MVANETGRDTMSSRFWIHDIEVWVEKRVSDGEGGSTQQWTLEDSFKGFLDTPSSDDILRAMQMTKTLDRTLYYPRGIGIVIPSKAQLRHLNVEGIIETYEISSKPKDQGGQNRFNALWLKLVT